MDLDRLVRQTELCYRHPDRHLMKLGALAMDLVIVGKVRDWDPDDDEYVLYGDGDLILAELTHEEVDNWDQIKGKACVDFAEEMIRIRGAGICSVYGGFTGKCAEFGHIPVVPPVGDPVGEGAFPFVEPQVPLDRSGKIVVDPPSGWMYGFPRVYDPEPGEPEAEWFLRNGYPAKMLDQLKYCRWWDKEVE